MSSADTLELERGKLTSEEQVWRPGGSDDSLPTALALLLLVLLTDAVSPLSDGVREGSLVRPLEDKVAIDLEVQIE